MIPAAVRDRAGLASGTVLCLFETPGGLVLLKRDQLRDRVRADLAGLDLVSELLAERRVAAEAGGCCLNVLDASAILAYLLGEQGADRMEDVMNEGAVCGAANWSEVAQKVRAAGEIG